MTPFHPSMANAWDTTPFPTRGDTAELPIAAEKGWAITEWETFEVELGELYSVFVGKSYRSREAFALYSRPANFSARMDALEAVGKAYFVTHPDQGLEGEFYRVTCRGRQFSYRRNEIVHSCIRALAGIPANATTANATISLFVFLAPPLYQDRKFNAANRPAFLYSSKEIGYYKECLRGLIAQASTLLYQLRGLGKPPSL
jgi:hypothetical protein